MKTIEHPDYQEKVEEWRKFRTTYKGGEKFVKEYLVQRSGENTEEFEQRTILTHCPAHAKSNLNEIKNSIFTRMRQGVTRVGGSLNYQAAVKGRQGGVDRKHSSMTGYIGSDVLPQLLSIGKLGIWVDAPVGGGQPYFVLYHAEDIKSWVDDPENPGQFLQILLKRHTFEVDEEFGFPREEVTSYRIVRKVEDGIAYMDFDEDMEAISDVTRLNLESIPFVVAELTESLLTDVADYQITLLNLDSSDISYCWHSNVPVFTEQIDQNDTFNALMNQVTNESQELELTRDGVLDAHGVDPRVYKRGQQRRYGVSEGIGYSKGLERPGFISPSSEPLEVSMKKQEIMRDDIRTLINLSLSNIEPRAASAESKMVDQRGLEAGLSAIGLELEALENRLAELWAMYEETEKADISYPEEYELKSDEDRMIIAERMMKLKEKFPGQMIKKVLMREAAETLVSGKITTMEQQQIYREIEESNGCTGDPESITSDLENGLLSAESASKYRGYGPEEVKKAQEEKAERMKNAMNAQRGSEDFEGARERGEGKFNDEDA